MERHPPFVVSQRPTPDPVLRGPVIRERDGTRPGQRRLGSLGLYAAASLMLCMAASPNPNLGIGTNLATATPGNFPGALTVPSTLPQTQPQAGGLFTPAPTPNQDLLAPLLPNTDKGKPTVAPGLFQPKNQYQGEGYVPGSTVQSEQDRRVRIAPGINLHVPLN